MTAKHRDTPIIKRAEKFRWLKLSRHIESDQFKDMQSPIDLAGDEIYPQNRAIRSLMRADYSDEGQSPLLKIESILIEAGVLDIPVRRVEVDGVEIGLVQAAERVTGGVRDETNYDAIWVRDSAWAALALAATGRGEDAKLITRGLLTYFGSDAQLKRFKAIRADPRILSMKNPNRQMDVPHIRFTIHRSKDGKINLDDVLDGAKPQRWNHLQNDALGLTLIALADHIDRGIVDVKDLTEREIVAIIYLSDYLSSFIDIEDGGAWEESCRRNSSSIGIAAAALGRIAAMLEDNGSLHAPLSTTIYRILGIDIHTLLSQLKNGRDLGKRIAKEQIASGGESPNYPADSKKYRTSDAALLSLIYPAYLDDSTAPSILKIVDGLVRERGVIRYDGDTYQGANSWFGARKAQHFDYTDRENERNSQWAHIKSGEAEWFFDSWISIACGILFEKSGDAIYKTKQQLHFNRALSQVTDEVGTIGADGNAVPQIALPESYNIISIHGTDRSYLPSPITPLNWAKASMLLAMTKMKR